MSSIRRITLTVLTVIACGCFGWLAYLALHGEADWYSFIPGIALAWIPFCVWRPKPAFMILGSAGLLLAIYVLKEVPNWPVPRSYRNYFFIPLFAMGAVIARGFWQRKQWALIGSLIVAVALLLGGVWLTWFWYAWAVVGGSDPSWFDFLPIALPIVGPLVGGPIAWLVYFSRRRIRSQFH